MKYLLLVFSAFLSQHVCAQKFKINLVKDINPDSFDVSHSPKILCAFNGKLILANTQTDNGNYFLYSLDVADSNKLELLSASLYNPSEAIVLGNQIVFAAEDLSHGLELWVSDGTAVGTKLLKDIYPGKTGSNIKGLTLYNGRVYFSANDSLHGQELWHSDGANSTVLLKDIDTGVSSSNPNNFIVYNGKLCFEAYSKNAMYQLYSTDGTEAATNAFTQVQGYKDFHFVNSKLFIFNGKLVFSGFDPVNGDQLWSSNGTNSGTSLLKLINTSGNSSPRDFILFKNQLVFTANNGIDGYELWMSDGTANNTKALSNKNPQLFVNRPESLLVYNNYLYYSLNDGIGGFELWRTDLNSSTQTLVKDINPGAASSYVSAPIVFKGLMVFSAISKGENQVWVSDGTENGTRSVVFPGSNKKNPLNLQNFMFFELASKLYFPANYKSNEGPALYVFDVDSQSGISDNKEANIIVYPNPLNSNVLNFSESLSGELINQLGQTVLVFHQKTELDLQNLSNGVYWIKADGYNSIKVILAK